MGSKVLPLRFAAHSRFVQDITVAHGWLPAARYTNLRDVRSYDSLGFLDIEWKAYDFALHLRAAKATRPHLTIARDVTDLGQLSRILEEGDQLLEWCDRVAIVPKDSRFNLSGVSSLIPERFMLAYSVPTRYGGTDVRPDLFDRETHLLGGSPAKQLALANSLPVYSLDCNRFTIDAKFGDRFDGERFVRSRELGYRECLRQSVVAINSAWAAKVGQASSQSYQGRDYPSPSASSSWSTASEAPPTRLLASK